jgi:hypothetical protein
LLWARAVGADATLSIETRKSRSVAYTAAILASG